MYNTNVCIKCIHKRTLFENDFKCVVLMYTARSRDTCRNLGEKKLKILIDIRFPRNHIMRYII